MKLRHTGLKTISWSRSQKVLAERLKVIARDVAFVKEITHGKPAPLLIYLADSPVLDKATRKFSTEQLPVIYRAMAMVSKPGLSRLIMNILFRFTSPPIPMKSFVNDGEAKM